MISTETIFDDVFKTICERMPDLLVPVINEAFGTDYPLDVNIVRLDKELQFGDRKLIADAHLLIADKRYHIECQSTNDKRMIVRMLEYDLAIALEAPQEAPDGYAIVLPRSCVVYLRGQMPERKDLSVSVIVDNETLGKYTVKALEVENYDVDGILAKSLLAFLPYYVMRYEKAPDDLENPRFNDDFSKVYNGLRRVYRKDKERFLNLCNLIRRVTDYVLRNKPQMQERAGEIMGGKVLQLESERLREEGQLEGMLEGERIGKLEGERIGQKKGERIATSRFSSLIVHLTQDGRSSEILEAAQDSKKRDELMKEYNLV